MSCTSSATHGDTILHIREMFPSYSANSKRKSVIRTFTVSLRTRRNLVYIKHLVLIVTFRDKCQSLIRLTCIRKSVTHGIQIILARQSQLPAVTTAGLKCRMWHPIRGFKVAYMDTVTTKFIQEAVKMKPRFITRRYNTPQWGILFQVLQCVLKL